MPNTIPADIPNLVAVGASVRVASPLGPVLTVGNVAATTCDVFVDGAAPTQHNLADLVLDLDDDTGADRAVRWALQEHADDLHRIREDRALLAEQCLRLAGDPSLPALTFLALPDMSTIWDAWLPGGPAAPVSYDVRIAAHRDVVLRWVAYRLSVALVASPPGFYWAGANAPSRTWRIETDAETAVIDRTGLSYRDTPTKLDRRYGAIGQIADENDDGRALALVALQVGIIQNPNDPNAGAWVTRRDELLAEIIPEP